MQASQFYSALWRSKVPYKFNPFTGNFDLVNPAQVSFETVSKNLVGQAATLNYTGSQLTSIVYGPITKTLNYTGSQLTSVVLSGATPFGITLTKTLIYTGSQLTSFSYS